MWIEHWSRIHSFVLLDTFLWKERGAYLYLEGFCIISREIIQLESVLVSLNHSLRKGSFLNYVDHLPTPVDTFTKKAYLVVDNLGTTYLPPFVNVVYDLMCRLFF